MEDADEDIKGNGEGNGGVEEVGESDEVGDGVGHLDEAEEGGGDGD